MSEPLIDQKSQELLKAKFENELQNEVDLAIFLNDEPDEYDDFTRRLCQELHELDDRIKPIVYQNG